MPGGFARGIVGAGSVLAAISVCVSADDFPITSPGRSSPPTDPIYLRSERAP
jgi:hypothetical protein